MASDNDRTMRLIMEAYQQGGAQAVREVLTRAGLPEAAITNILAQIEAVVKQPQIMPQQQLQALLQNTYAVKTAVPEKLVEWRAAVQEFRDGAAQRGDDWAIEVALADGLLNLLDDKPAALPDDNPYQPYLQQLIAAIAAGKK